LTSSFLIVEMQLSAEAWSHGSRRRLRIGCRTHDAAATRDTLDLELAHQPGDSLPADRKAVAETQLGVEPWRPVAAVGVVPGFEDPRLQPLVLLPSAAGRPSLPGPVAIVWVLVFGVLANGEVRSSRAVRHARKQRGHYGEYHRG